MTALITPVREITLDGRPAFTTTEQSFTDAGVKWMNDDFKSQFIGLEVAESVEVTFVVSKLNEHSHHAPIISELGGSEKVEASTVHFIDLLNRNKQSREYFILWLRGKDGNLWTVNAFWSVGAEGWLVPADSTSRRSKWRLGSSIVSRK